MLTNMNKPKLYNQNVELMKRSRKYAAMCSNACDFPGEAVSVLCFGSVCGWSSPLY
jgi:hypothetical protein